MMRKHPLRATIALLASIVFTGCVSRLSIALSPTETPWIINPPVMKGDQPTSTPRPTPTPTPASEAPSEPLDAAITEPFTVNGVTMPFNRSEAIISDASDLFIFDSFNPMLMEQYTTGVGQLVREYLWYVNYATGELIPWLGERWKYNDDYTELRLYLRKGVTWNDGEPFTSADVVWTWTMAMDPAYDDLGGFPHLDTDYWSRVYAADDYTVIIEMTEPRPRQHLAFWCRLISGTTIYPAHIWANEDPRNFRNNPPVWTGPYKLHAVYPENKVIVWVRNEAYWGRALGYFPAAKYAIVRAGSGGELQLSELKGNLTDILLWNYDLYQANREALPHINPVIYVDPCPRGAWFNTAKEPHLTQPEFRRAMSMLMNREKWAANIWSPPSKPAEGLWAEYSILDTYINEEAKERWGTLQYNPERALELLTSIGYRQEGGKLLGPDGKQVTLAVTTPWSVGTPEYLMGQDFTAEIKQIGIDATFEHVEGIFWQKASMGEMEIGFLYFCGASVDPEELFRWFTCDEAVPIGEAVTSRNMPRYCNEAYDQALRALQVISQDDPAAHTLYMQLFDLWLEDPPGVPLIETYYTTAFNTTYWDGMPSTEDLYTVPFNWWGQIEQVYFKVTPAKR